MNYDWEMDVDTDLQTPQQRFPTLAPRANLRPITTSRDHSYRHKIGKDSLLLEIDHLHNSEPHNSHQHHVRSNTIVSTSDANDSDVSSIASSDDEDDEFLLCTPDRMTGSQRMIRPISMGSSPFSLTPRKMTSAELPQIPQFSPSISSMPSILPPERKRNLKRKRRVCWLIDRSIDWSISQYLSHPCIIDVPRPTTKAICTVQNVSEKDCTYQYLYVILGLNRFTWIRQENLKGGRIAYITRAIAAPKNRNIIFM